MVVPHFVNKICEGSLETTHGPISCDFYLLGSVMVNIDYCVMYCWCAVLDNKRCLSDVKYILTAKLLNRLKHINTSEIAYARFKSGDPMLFNNYRPVSLLCVLSKVFEKVMYSRLLSFIENHNLLFQYQFGFRQMHSSYMALMIMMDKITAAMDRGDLVVGIFLDFSNCLNGGCKSYANLLMLA